MAHPTATAVEIRGDRIHVSLADGRELLVPIAWFDWLAAAPDALRDDLEIIEGGEAIWWESLEESISVPALFGIPHH